MTTINTTPTINFQTHVWSNPQQLTSHIDDEGKIWFVAKEVCDLLGIQNPSQMVKALDEDEAIVMPMDSMGQNNQEESKICPMRDIGQNGEADLSVKPITSVGQTLGNRKLHGKKEINLISESGLYHILFLSRKPIARRFRRWITDEVIPSIRQTGGYNCIGSNASLHIEHMRSELERRLLRGDKHRIHIELGIPSERLSAFVRGKSMLERSKLLDVFKWLNKRDAELQALVGSGNNQVNQ